MEAWISGGTVMVGVIGVGFGRVVAVEYEGFYCFCWGCSFFF